MAEKILLHDEKVLYSCTKHWAIFLPAFFWSICTIIALFMPNVLKLLAIITAVFAIFYAVRGFEKYWCYKYILTTKRIVIREGWFSNHSTEIFLQKIDSFKIAQNLFGKLLGFGTLVIIGTAGSEQKLLVLNNPTYFRSRIQYQLEKLLNQIPDNIGTPS